MKLEFYKHRIVFIVAGICILIGVSVAPFAFMGASCSTRQRLAGEKDARATLRNMTRAGVIPAEDAVAKIEATYPNTRTAGLARMVRARIRIKNGDFAGAVLLLNSKPIEFTALPDYGLFMRANALEKAGRRVEARALFEQLASEYPSSIRAREASLAVAETLMQNGGGSAVPVSLKVLRDNNDPAALLISGKAYEQSSDPTRALGEYRRIYFYAPASAESAAAATAIARLNSTLAPGKPEEAISRADKLLDSRRFADAALAYGDAFARFPNLAVPASQLHRGIAASNAGRIQEAVQALNSVPSFAGDIRAEALYHLVETYAKARQWGLVNGNLDELHRAFPASPWARKAFAAAGQSASSKSPDEAAVIFREALAFYPGVSETASAQFYIAWLAHEAKNFSQSARLLTDHLALYADKNSDFRGRAGYWAARDYERAGNLAEARVLYEAMQGRYSSNWYGNLARQRLETMKRNGISAKADFAPDSQIARAIANLQTVTVAEDTAGPEEMNRVEKAEELADIGTDDWALEELAQVSRKSPDSARINLAIAGIYRLREEKVRALNSLKKSYPDYSQMQPRELTREEWDVFYPLAYWGIIEEESRARHLDPYQVAGLIRQESVFDPHARSAARAYGLMQLLVPTGAMTARKYGIDRSVSAESLYEPRLNIELGTAYLRDQLDKFGRIEYVAAAYNAGPGNAAKWRSTLPLQIDEWAEAIPFKETRGYVQGVVRNTLQYKRLYDDQGQFREDVGANPVNGAPGENQNGAPARNSSNPTVLVRRIENEVEDE